MTSTRTQPTVRPPAATVFAVLVALHGLAHVAGVTGSSGVVAVAWAAAGAAMVVAAALVARRARAARAAVGVAAAASLALSVAFLWASAVGVVVDLALLVVVRRDPRSVFRGDDAAGHATGPVDLDAVDRFLAGHRVAVVGASSDHRKFGNTVFRALREHDYDAVPVNPSASHIDGVSCYGDVAHVPGRLDGVLVMVGGDAAVDAVHAAADRGVTRVWLFRGLGAPGALSAASLAACRDRGLDVVAGACPLMFLTPVGAVHDVHRALRRFNGAFADVA